MSDSEKLKLHFNHLLGLIPVNDEGTSEHKTAIEVIEKLKATFDIVLNVKDEVKERSGPVIPESGEASSDDVKSNRSDESMAKALHRISDALELLNGKTVIGTGLPIGFFFF